MSTKAHFICEDGVEGFEDVSEVKSIFGKFQGYNVYLLLENSVLKSFEMVDSFIIIETKNTTHLPDKFKIWGDAIIDFSWDETGLCIRLEGGHSVTKKVKALDFTIE